MICYILISFEFLYTACILVVNEMIIMCLCLGLRGHAFLPTGSGVVTRRPLILQLLHGSGDFGEFEHRPGRRFDFHEIRSEILRETEPFRCF